MGKERANKVHIVMLAYHGQGHINPMVQFSKRLAAKGIKITVTTTLSNTKAMESSTPSSSITLTSIYDDYTEGGVAGPGGFQGFLNRFKASGSRNLLKLIKKSQDSENPVKCLVYDANIPWASSVANEMGIARAAFFTQSCGFFASLYPKHCDLSGFVPSVPFMSMPGLPEMKLPNLPSLGPETGRYPPIIRFILSQFDNSENADWILFNSFDKLEDEVVSWMAKLWPVRTIGPTLPSVYLDNRVEGDNDYGFNIHKPNTENCINWLNSKEKNSVIYVSFGSNASLSTEQTAQLAKVLKESHKSFLWVVKPSEENKLPDNFTEEVSDGNKVLIVKWAPQLDVLSHDSVGCFVSHCGWNSTMEAISLGVPIVAMPQFLDQMANAHFVEHVWELGIKPNADDNGFSTSDEIRICIEEIMEGERGEVVKKNAVKWKDLAMEAIGENGSSDKNIDEIIAELLMK